MIKTDEFIEIETQIGKYTFIITAFGRYKRNNMPIRYWSLTAKLNLIHELKKINRRIY